MKKFLMLGLTSLGLFVLSAEDALAQRGGAARGGVRGAMVGGMVGGEQGAKVGAVVGATRSVVNQETQARAQYYANPAYQNAPRSDFNTAPPQVLTTTAPASPAAATSGGEAVLRKDGKPMVSITYPQDWKQTNSDSSVNAISPDGQAWAGLALLNGVDKQAGINKIKEGLQNYIADIQFDEPTETKNGALVVTGSGKGKKAGVDVVFAAGVFEPGKGQLAGAAFVVDSKIEDHYKETIRSICETIRRSDDLAK